MKKYLFALLIIHPFISFPQAPTNGLVAYYPLNGSGNNIVSQENQGVGSSIAYEDRFGNATGASLLNGGNGFSLGHMNLFNQTTSFTISFWVLSNFYDPFITNDMGRGYFFSVINNSRGFYIWTEKGALQVRSSSNPYYTSSPTNISDKVWHQVIISYANQKYDLFIDGVFDTSMDWSFFATSGNGEDPLATNSNSICKIGYPFSIDNSADYGLLVMDDLRIYNRSFNISEITQLYESEKVIEIPKLLADYTFNGTSVNPSVNYFANSFGESIVNSFDGGKIIAGLTINANAGLDKSNDNIGNYDLWVLKLNKAHQKIWDVTLGGLASENGDDQNYYNYKQKKKVVDVLETKDNKILILGSSNSGVSGNKSTTLRGYNDFWLIKLDENGNKIWDKSYGGTYIDYAANVEELPNGDFILFGGSRSSASFEKSEPSIGSSDEDFWIIKIDKDGNKLWDKTIGGNLRDIAKKLVIMPNGDFILGGTSFSGVYGNKTEASRGACDLWLIKLNSNGVKIWDRTFGGVKEDWLSDITITSDGNIAVLATSYSDSGYDKTHDNKMKIATGNISTDSDLWVLKIDQNGNKIWDRTYGGYNGNSNSYDYGKSILAGKDGSMILLSNYNGSGSFDISSGNCYPGNLDILIYSINNFGNKDWDLSIGGIMEDFGNDICEGSDGNYYITGYSYSINNCKKRAEKKSERGYDMWMIKIGNITKSEVYYIEAQSQTQKGTPLKVNFKAISH